MSYNFKSLADVELLSAMPENAKVIVEVDGATRRAPQVNIATSEMLSEVPEGATVLAEVNGEIKRVPGSELGGSKSIIFNVPSEGVTECNYSPEEVNELMLAGANCVLIVPYEIIMGSAPTTLDDSGVMPTIMRMTAIMDGQMSDGTSMFMFMSDGLMVQIMYYSNGTIENSLFSAES